MGQQGPELSGTALINDLRGRYREHAEKEHGSMVNPITGEEVDIMQQCVNLQLDTGANHEVGDIDAYREVIADFAEHLGQGLEAWVALEGGEYQSGRIHRVNNEDEQTVTYDFQYTKPVSEGGKTKAKSFILKDCGRRQVKTRQVLVKGDPAGGKTTFAKQLLTWVMRNAETQWLVPVLIRTVDLVRSKRLFVDDGTDMVDQYLALQYAEPGFYHLFQLARTHGRLLVIIDGFDEAGLMEAKLAEEISQRLNNEVFIVLTSREMGSTFDGAAFARFRHVRVKELSGAQQRQVIERRLRAADAVQHFCTQLTLNPALSQMAKNPLLLNVTLSVFDSSRLGEQGSLNRGKVYSLALDGMLGSVEKAKALDVSVPEAVSAKALRTLLKRIAFLAHTYDDGRGIRDFRRNVIRAAIETSGLGGQFSMEQWYHIEDLVKKGRLPILTWFSEAGEDTFRFSHLTFQEFLCAEQCLHECTKSDGFIEELRELVCPFSPERQIMGRGWWQQTIQMFCDLASNAGARDRAGKCLGSVLGECFLRLGSDGEGGGARGASVEFPSAMNDNNILTLFSMVRTSTTLTEMRLGGEITSQGISTIRVLRVSALQRLYLNDNQIGPEGCAAVAEFMVSGSAPLEELQLVNNIICQGPPKEGKPPDSRRNPPTGYYDSHVQDLAGLQAVLDVVKGHPTMKRIDLRGNFLNLRAGRMISEAVLANDNLTDVCGVSLQQLRTGGLEGDVLEFENPDHFFRPTSVGRSGPPFLATGGAAFLLDMLLRHPQPHLRGINLANQALACDSEHVVDLYDMLGTVVAGCRKLETLNLRSFWDSGAAAGQALGRRIKEHPTLRHLHVGTGCLDMAEIRAKGQSGSPEAVGLRGCRVRDCGAGILSECLPANVFKLCVNDTGVGGCGYKVLSTCPQLQEINGISLVAFTPACTSIDLSQNPAETTGAVASVIARTVLTPNLTHLNLSGSSLVSKSHIHVLTPVVGGHSGIACNGGCDARHFEGTNAYTHCQKCDLDFCSTCCMSECPMIALAESLQRLPHLVSLKIANCCFEGGRLGPVRSNLDEEGYRVLGEALSKHGGLTDLDLSCNFFEGPGFPHLLRGVARMPALSTIRLGNDTISYDEWLGAELIKTHSDWRGVELLLLSLTVARCKRLRHLDMCDVSRHVHSQLIVQALVDSLAQRACGSDGSCAALDMLVVDGVGLPFGELPGGDGSKLDFRAEEHTSRAHLAPLFAYFLSLGNTYASIDFSNNDFGCETEAVVSSILPLAQGQLREYNGLALQCNADSLSVRRMPVMSHGVWVFASTALQTARMRELDLSGCGLDHSGLGVLLGVLLKRQTLVSLDVSNNSLDTPGIQHLTTFLRRDGTLQVLLARYIGRRSLQLPEMREFSKAIESNSTLATLDIRGNSLNPEIVDSLKRTMEEKRSTVPMPLDAKITFLLCNQRVPYRLPEVAQVAEASRLYVVGACSPLFLIFQFCGQARRLLVDPPSNPQLRWNEWLGRGWREVADSDDDDDDDDDEYDDGDEANSFSSGRSF